MMKGTDSASIDTSAFETSRQRLLRTLRRSGIINPAVIDAIATVPRHVFVDEVLAHHAYDNTALPIGRDQTISQPYVVALMTQAVLEAKVEVKRVLEIGTGSGYQAAILAKLFDEVYTVERIKSLWEVAHSRFRTLRLRNVKQRYDDGSKGWKRYAPYDAILVTAAAHQIPDELKEQLADGGRLVIPVDAPKALLSDYAYQQLLVIDRSGDRYTQKDIESVQFVRLTPGIS